MKLAERSLSVDGTKLTSSLHPHRRWDGDRKDEGKGKRGREGGGKRGEEREKRGKERGKREGERGRGREGKRERGKDTNPIKSGLYSCDFISHKPP